MQPYLEPSWVIRKRQIIDHFKQKTECGIYLGLPWQRIAMCFKIFHKFHSHFLIRSWWVQLWFLHSWWQSALQRVFKEVCVSLLSFSSVSRQSTPSVDCLEWVWAWNVYLSFILNCVDAFIISSTLIALIEFTPPPFWWLPTFSFGFSQNFLRICVQLWEITKKVLFTSSQTGYS